MAWLVASAVAHTELLVHLVPSAFGSFGSHAQVRPVDSAQWAKARPPADLSYRMAVVLCSSARTTRGGWTAPAEYRDVPAVSHCCGCAHEMQVAGTERGVVDPEATFSACFGAAFMPLHPTRSVPPIPS